MIACFGELGHDCMFGRIRSLFHIWEKEVIMACLGCCCVVLEFPICECQLLTAEMFSSWDTAIETIGLYTKGAKVCRACFEEIGHHRMFWRNRSSSHV